MQERYFELMDERKVHYLLHIREKYDLLRLKETRIQELIFHERANSQLTHYPCVVADGQLLQEIAVSSPRDLIGRKILVALNSTIKKASAPIATAGDCTISDAVIKSFLDPVRDMESTSAFAHQSTLFEARLATNGTTFLALLEHEGKRWYITSQGENTPIRQLVISFDGRDAAAVEPGALLSWNPNKVEVSWAVKHYAYTLIHLKPLGSFSSEGVVREARKYRADERKVA